MTIDELAQQLARGFAAMADGLDAVATEMRATRIHIAKVKGQRELDKEAVEEDLNALGTQVQEVERRLRLVTPKAFPAVVPPGAKPAE